MTYSRLAACCLALALPGATQAKPAVALDSAVFVERMREDTRGIVRSLEQPVELRRGDRIIGVVTWYRLGGSGSFTVTNALPRGVYYQGSAADEEQVSVDGGSNWGRLGTLQIGARLASAEDVTHVRWRVPASSASRGQGRIAYSGIVR